MARTGSGNDGRGVDDGRGGAPGERVGPDEFESGLDYAAFEEDDETNPEQDTDRPADDSPWMSSDPPTDELDRPDDSGSQPTEAIDRSALDRPGVAETQPTVAIDRSALDRFAAEEAGHTGSHPAPGLVAREDRPADVVTASARPDEGIGGGHDSGAGAAGAWGSGAGATPVPVAADYRGYSSGSSAADSEERRRELRDAEARAAARDEALEGSSAAPRLLQVLLAVFFPIVVLIAAVRLVASPVFLWLEYHRPGFPADPFGFTTEDRLTYGSAGMDYLFNAAPPRYLSDWQHEGAALFTDTEVSHMVDVKIVMLVTMAVGLLLGLLSIVFMVALARTTKGGIRRALFVGSLWMLVAVIVVGVLAVLGWEQFFAAFHSLFFADGTWTFAASDTLIRLYPSQFWIDAGLAVAVLAVLALVITLICTWPTRRRRQDSRLAQLDLIRRRNAWAHAD